MRGVGGGERPKLPLAAASARLRGHPGRPRTVRAPGSPGYPGQGAGLGPAPGAANVADFATALPPRGLSVDAAAAYVGLSRRQLYRLAERGLVPLIRFPGCRRVIVDRLTLDRLLERAKDPAWSPS